MNKNKKLISIIAVVCLFVVAIVAGTSSSWKSSSNSGSELVSGTFEGTAQGLGGEVVVTLTLEDNVITDVVAVGDNETDGIGTKALDKIPGEIVAGNTLSVDSVSGATVTSDAIIEAAKAALAAAGLTPEDLVAADTTQTAAEDIEETTDVVIIGAGGAGLTAAITAADAGKSVIIVESQDVAGGNSVRSTGGMNASETEFEDENEWDAAGEAEAVEATLTNAAENYADNEAITALAATVKEQWDAYQANPEGYFDSVELMELDTMIGGKGTNDPALVETLAANSADAITWVNEQSKEADESNSGLTSVGQFGGASVKRIHRPVNAEGKTTAVGAYIMPILEKNLESRDVTVYYNTTATEILMDGDAAVGILAEGKDGNSVTIHASSVIIATGGFGANNEMVVAQDHPELEGYITTNAIGAQGQGITMAEAVGADTVDMDQIQLHPTVHVDDNGNAHLITEGLRGDGAILVNKEGERFYNEVSTRDKVSAAENEQTDGMAWLIVDQEMVDASAVIQGYINNGYTVTGNTYEELAEAMGVDAETFAATMETWNGYVENKEDPDFGRTSFVKQLNVGPYYALTVQPGIHHTMGGLKINSSAAVLNASGEEISGLFAAGEVTGGVHGANRLGGNAVADFIVYGRIAGASAAANAE